MKRALKWHLLALIALVAVSGCDANSVRKLTVTATFDGAPLADADVLFVPKDDPSLGGSSGRTAADGKVEIMMNKHMKMRAGRYVAVVTRVVDRSGKPIKDTPDLAMPVAGDMPSGGPHNMLPVIYASPASSPLIVTVDSGDAKVELKLLKNP